MKSFWNAKRLQRCKTVMLAATGIACLLSPAAWPASDIITAEAERMAAASPQRERYRDWTICINNVAALVIPQDATMQKLRDMIILGCDEQESRLTGSLIAKYGYARGNSAMRALKQSAEARFQIKITQRDHPSVSSDFFEDTAQGWKVRRIAGGCVAMLRNHDGLNAGGSGVGLAQSNGKPSINFFLLGSAVSIADTTSTTSFEVAATIWIGSRTDKVQLVLTPSALDGGMMYVAGAPEALIAQLDQAQTIQFRVPSYAPIKMPATYRLGGVASAWAAVQRCVGH